MNRTTTHQSFIESCGLPLAVKLRIHNNNQENINTMNVTLSKSEAQKPRRSFQSLKRETILCVDDDSNILRLHRRKLEQDGYDVETARDGAEAWERIRRKHFDLVITDNEMPHMTGLELAREIRLADMDLSLVLATGTVNCLLDVDLSHLRFSAILHKPFSLDELGVVIRRVMLFHGIRKNRDF